MTQTTRKAAERTGPQRSRPDRPDRIAHRQADKFSERRAELAASALLTLSELGYARTSLREIAQNSSFSHGVLHYYFRDKIELIVHSVRQYKTECVTRYDDIVAQSESADALRRGIGSAMAQTVVDDAPMHRLWYDLRTQSFFEPSLRADVVAMDEALEAMIWRIVCRYAELADGELSVSSPVAYAIFDGLFQQSLLKHQSGEAGAPLALQVNVETVLANQMLRP